MSWGENVMGRKEFIRSFVKESKIKMHTCKNACFQIYDLIIIPQYLVQINTLVRLEVYIRSSRYIRCHLLVLYKWL